MHEHGIEKNLVQRKKQPKKNEIILVLAKQQRKIYNVWNQQDRAQLPREAKVRISRELRSWRPAWAAQGTTMEERGQSK